jgi:RHS repeat-associated protein
VAENKGLKGSETDSAPTTNQISAPTISLPKGGGAIRGMGEKFAANSVTGTGSMSVPIATSPGRSGFGPQLSLSYDSGAGNGPFGFGWSLSLPQITRKTDKGLPQYYDAEESDVFVLSGAEDLVPVFKRDADGNLILGPEGKPLIDDRLVDGYNVRRYLPRIEGLFARIERWTRQSDGEVHWRSISKDNILTIYGKDKNSRILDPTDTNRIFTWLICATRDDRGNAILYEYKAEDGVGVDLTGAHERNRGDRNDPRRATNRYLKRIRYGNRVPLLDNAWRRPRLLDDAQILNADWMFEVVFDYGEHNADAPKPDDAGQWTYRSDPFSTYRAGFEVRAGRLCQRVLMFHHFAGEPDVGLDCLVRSTDFAYSHEQDHADARNPIYTFLLSVTQTGYKRNNSGYQGSRLPSVEYEYTQPIVQDTVQEMDAASLENLPIGLDGAAYQWTDLHGEGIPGILTEQAGAWFYNRNISPIGKQPVEFAPLERVATKPNLALAGGAQFMDLAGDGQSDLVMLDGPMPGLYEHDEEEGWEPFRPFTSCLNRDMRDPNLKFVDLDGDGHADVLITEDDAFVWHPSLAEEGFGPARRVHQALDEEKGPRLVFVDGTQSIYLADLNGDGLTDLVRLRNGEVCYWPNLGYGRFGAKITMDHAPQFDNPDQFDHKRIRLADIDGSGTTDIIYLHRDGVRLYFNQSGNSWSEPHILSIFPRIDDLVSIVPTDLLGNGTACLVWSSPLPSDARRQMRYVDLMGGQKPHLLVKTINNLGAETRVQYVPSTKFYLQDKRDEKPWTTRLPFPVHVVERVETYDHISHNRFVTRYAYHHGYFDGEEREFRGFGMVEQWDTEEFSSLAPSGGEGWGEGTTNWDTASNVPPVHTKTWFHTGVYVGRDHVSDFFAGIGKIDGEYYREPALRGDDVHDPAAIALLLPDTVLPSGLTLDEEREACRALKGAMLRQEVYALDGTTKAPHPYTITEQNFTIRHVQPHGVNRHAIFFTHPCEAITYHYERNPADPRVQHALTLEVDPFGNVLKEAAIGYGRRLSDPTLPLQVDRDKQTQTLITFTENRVTNPINDGAVFPDAYRTPLPCETRTYELSGYTPTGTAGRFQPADFVQAAGDALTHIFDTEIDYEDAPTNGKQRRVIEQTRTLYRMDDLTSLLPLGQIEPLALPGESYQLAFTPGLLAQVFQRNGHPLLPNPANVLSGEAADRGGYLPSHQLKADGRFPITDPDDHWWIPAGRIFLSLNSNDTAAQELAYARNHFFLPLRYRDPFHTIAVSTESFVTYDTYDLLMVETRDPLNNRITVGERLPNGNLDTTKPGNDYRVLQPWRMMDPNRNRTQVAFDALGMVVGTAIMGKPEETLGDSLDGFEADLTEAVVLNHLANPLADPHAILGRATTRLVYDLFAYHRTKDQPDPQSAVVYTLACATHDADLDLGQTTKVQHSFSYSDGFGREIQKKIQAEPEKINGIIGPPRWVGSGWTIFNNKGKPVRQYEPFFSAVHGFEFGVQVGVSPILFYDPAERVIATLHPNHTWGKVVFDPWRQEAWDVNDTVLQADPKNDPDVGDFFRRLPDAEYLPTWHEARKNGQKGPEEKAASEKTATHADTPTTTHFDTLGRPFLTLADNGPDPTQPDQHLLFATRVELDIEGNQRTVRDAIEQASDKQGRIVMRYAYDMLGNRIHQRSMEAGARWMLNDVAGKPIRAWDSRDHQFHTAYDALRRPTDSYLREDAGPERLIGRTVYGENQPNPEASNLRNKVAQLFDQAGVVTSDEYDFKGNLLRSQRQLAKEYKTILDWSATVPLESETYTSRTTYDALNRPTELTTPHTSATQPSVIRPGYNEANLLDRVDANLRGATANGQPVWTPFVTNIDYDAKGQRQRIDYGNGVSTVYDYDPLMFRLTRLLTLRGATPLQDLFYTYDPAGNITSIRDEAQQTIYFKNQIVEPHADYVYDAIYRLIEATGREHIGQASKPEMTWSDEFRINLPHPSDGQAMRRYVEHYDYDRVGNFLQLIHQASNGNWTRGYTYNEASLVEPAKMSNGLSGTAVGSIAESYAYDAHGNMLTMPHLQSMQWDFRDQLRQIDLGGGGTAYYIYDAAGQRVRKVIERQNSTRQKERIYLSGFEIYREYNGNGDIVTIERETLHVMDDKQRIALVETRTLDTAGNDQATRQLIRYQLGNHLGSASLELDDHAQIISYEEYSPYGSSTYQAVRSQTETPKRYRYTGKERDEESGLYYHGARYYAAWVGRWTNCDPLGIRSGHENLFEYVRCNPVIFRDPNGKDEQESVLSEVVKGDFHEGKTTWTGTLLNVGVGLIPIVGQVADARDTAAAAKSLWNEPGWGNAGILGLAVVGWVPLVGDAIKGGSKVGGKVVTEAAEEALEKSAKEAAEKATNEAAQKAEKEAAVKAEKEAADKAAKEAAEKATKETAAKEATDSAKSVKGSSKPGAGEALVGSSRRQMRDAAAKKIASDPNHPLRFLLDEKGKFKEQSGLTHAELADRPEIAQMGHIQSNKTGGKERLMLQGAWENQFNNVTIESPHVGGAVLDQTAVEIGGIAVDLKTAKFWEEIEFLMPGTVVAAPRIFP